MQRAELDAQVSARMTTHQMKAWLEAMPEAARLIDAEGQTLAQNIRANGHAPERKHITSHDIGEGWRLEMWRPLKVADPDLRALANGLAHTLRNPLSSIMTAADLVKDDPNVSEESEMLLGIIAKESRQLNRILTDFLNYVRPRTTPPASFDLAKALRDTVGALRQEKALPEGIEIEDNLPAVLPALGDEHAIRQSLHHVVKNAVEAMNGKGTLHLCGEAFDTRGLVHVEDNGTGFSSEGLEHAFDPFYSYTPECAGLGLSVAMAAVERAGGRITIENVHHHEGESREHFEYSNGQTTSAKPVQGARVCIELNAPDSENSGSQATQDDVHQDEVLTV